MIQAFIPLISTVLDRILPDDESREKAKLELYKIETEKEFQQMLYKKEIDLGQLKINEVEASHQNVFVSGWRPAAGWLTIAGLAYHYLVFPIFSGHIPELKDIPTEDLMYLLFALLGMGGLRSFEKIKGVANKK